MTLQERIDTAVELFTNLMNEVAALRAQSDKQSEVLKMAKEGLEYYKVVYAHQESSIAKQALATIEEMEKLC